MADVLLERMERILEKMDKDISRIVEDLGVENEKIGFGVVEEIESRMKGNVTQKRVDALKIVNKLKKEVEELW